MTIIAADLGADSEKDTGTSLGWFLVGCLGQNDGLTQISIGRVPFTIGRASSNDFTLSSRNVSKFHADIIVAVDAVIVRDLGSTNGTFVNGTRIAGPTPVGDGDLLQFADMEFRLGRTNARSGERTAISTSPEDGWLISRVHEVVNLGRFSMVFQPIVAARGLQPIGVEALVRSQVGGLETPAALFDAAARLGLHERLSVMCRTRAVEALAQGPADLQLFVNTHPSEHLGGELVQSLALLRDTACGRRLVLEIHEAAVPDLSAMREFRAALRDLGIGLAYDDFGAGQSRLLELTEVPPDYLKFDRSLLQESALASESHRSLVATLVRHATDAGIAAVAEGLESQEAVEACRAMGFSFLQGYHLGRPVFADDLR